MISVSSDSEFSEDIIRCINGVAVEQQSGRNAEAAKYIDACVFFSSPFAFRASLILHGTESTRRFWSILT